MKDVRVLQEFVYRVDRRDRILYVSDPWVAFAQANGASGLTRESVFGRSLWSFFSGAEICYLYGALMARVRSARRTVTVPFRCDGPDVRRHMELEMIPLAHGGVEFRSRLLAQEARAPVFLLDPTIPRSVEQLTICSWCKKVQLEPALWVEVEEAIVQFELFGDEQMPELAHATCPSCSERLRGSLAAVNSVAYRPIYYDEWDAVHSR